MKRNRDWRGGEGDPGVREDRAAIRGTARNAAFRRGFFGGFAMTDVVRELGVQSWCFRRFKDNETVISKIRECGISKVELAGVHADFKDEKKVISVAELYRKEGIEIVSIGVQ
ncbi:MAG: hypothetical protein N3A38_17425, partial [Planctomycetota bacterium]|nr:hypothetical protein [Planctomycetota bacterium]